MNRHNHVYIEKDCSFYFDWFGTHVKKIIYVCSVCGKKKVKKKIN